MKEDIAIAWFAWSLFMSLLFRDVNFFTGEYTVAGGVHVANLIRNMT